MCETQILRHRVADSAGLGWGPRERFVSNKFQVDADATDPGPYLENRWSFLEAWTHETYHVGKLRTEVSRLSSEVF